ncbi:MAG: thiamine pyrophosphate-binding protein, partial [Mobilitalea sp.]
MKEERSGAKYIADFLKSYDVTHVFYVLAMLRETLAEMEKVGIKRITTHGEKAATYMADGYARISRRPGIAMAQSVGAANLAAGLQDAYLGHSPVIALSGRKPPQAQYRNAYQEIIHGSMYEAVTKYNVNVDKGEQLPILLRQAFREATSGAPRPVHMDILGYTGEIIEKETIIGPLVVEERYKSFPAVRIDPNNTDIERALNFIKAASKPVIVAGSGAVSSDSGKEVLEFSKALSIPVAFSC